MSIYVPIQTLRVCVRLFTIWAIVAIKIIFPEVNIGKIRTCIMCGTFELLEQLAILRTTCLKLPKKILLMFSEACVVESNTRRINSSAAELALNHLIFPLVHTLTDRNI